LGKLQRLLPNAVLRLTEITEKDCAHFNRYLAAYLRLVPAQTFNE